MAFSTTATLSSDIVFAQQNVSANTLDTRAGSLSYSQSLTAGTGSTEIDAAWNLMETGIDAAGALYLDFTAMEQPVFDSSYSINFTGVRGFAITNTATSGGEDIAIRATGSDALTGLFNGTGNLLVKPAASFVYSDPIGALTVDSAHKNLQIHNAGTESIAVNIVAVGVSG